MTDQLSIEEIVTIAKVMKQEGILHLKRNGQDVEILMSAQAMTPPPVTITNLSVPQKSQPEDKNRSPLDILEEAGAFDAS